MRRVTLAWRSRETTSFPANASSCLTISSKLPSTSSSPIAHADPCKCSNMASAGMAACSAAAISERIVAKHVLLSRPAGEPHIMANTGAAVQPPASSTSRLPLNWEGTLLAQVFTVVSPMHQVPPLVKSSSSASTGLKVLLSKINWAMMTFTN